MREVESVAEYGGSGDVTHNQQDLVSPNRSAAVALTREKCAGTSVKLCLLIRVSDETRNLNQIKVLITSRAFLPH